MTPYSSDDVYDDPDNILTNDTPIVGGTVQSIDPSDEGVVDDRGELDLTNDGDEDETDTDAIRLGDMDPADEDDGTES